MRTNTRALTVPILYRRRSAATILSCVLLGACTQGQVDAFGVAVEVLATVAGDDQLADSNTSEPFTEQPLRDFRIAVPSDRRKVEVCVRDHECEDGDRVTVSINGSMVLAEELYNSWSCATVPVWADKNYVTMRAVNGTGYKGNCSHRDVNTGEIRVRGSSSQTQSWRHRGGTGSHVKLYVTVQ